MTPERLKELEDLLEDAWRYNHLSRYVGLGLELLDEVKRLNKEKEEKED